MVKYVHDGAVGVDGGSQRVTVLFCKGDDEGVGW